jgi:long-chain acyl-CoA synthetase
VVSSHPGVLECGGIGIPDPRSGDAVKLFVVKKDPNLSEAALIGYCKDAAHALQGSAVGGVQD